ncbi:hypothetical protein K2W90_04270 [Candidatus Babeliales bacterium]|nr:hypothetical protein [Candidatus Babeliales bacterium]
MKFLRLLSKVLIFALGLATTAQPNDVKYLKGTDTVLKPEHRLTLSLACGALGIEMKYLQKLYHFGNPEHATIKLIRQLFHVVPGSFAPTQVSVPARYFSRTTVGKLLNILETYKNSPTFAFYPLVETLVNDQDFQINLNNQTFTQDAKDFVKYLRLKKELDRSNDKFSLFKQKALQLLNKPILRKAPLATIIETLEKENIQMSKQKRISSSTSSSGAASSSSSQSTFSDAEDDNQNDYSRKRQRSRSSHKEKTLKRQRQKEMYSVAQIIEGLKPHAEHEQLAKKFNTKQMPIYKHIVDFAQLLVDACAECQYFYTANTITLSSSASQPGPSYKLLDRLLYRPYTAQHTLLAWIYQKTNSKEDFKDYFNQLNERFFESETRPEQAWYSDSYADDEHTDIHAGLELGLAGKSEEETVESLTNADFADIVFTETRRQLYGKTIPCLSQHQKVSFKGIKFSNCVENTINNLCRIATNNKTTRTAGNANGLTLAPELNTFFQNNLLNKKEDTSGMQQVHQEWSNLIQNLPNITYQLATPANNTTIYFECPGNLNGFIRLNNIPVPSDAQHSTVAIIPRDSATQRVTTQPAHTFNTITVNNKSYILIQDDQYELFEIKALLKNITIITNHLLGIPSPSTMTGDFFSPTFTSPRFKDLCLACQWTLSNDHELDEEHNEQTLELEKTLSQEVEKKEGKAFFEIYIKPGIHACAERLNTEYKPSPYQQKLCSNLTLREDALTPHLLLLLDLYKNYDIKFGIYHKEQSFYAHNNFFMRNLLDDEEKFAILHRIIKTRNPHEINPNFIWFASQLIISLHATQTDENDYSIADYLAKSSKFVISHKDNNLLKKALKKLTSEILDEIDDPEDQLINLQSFSKILVILNLQAELQRVVDLASHYSNSNDEDLRLEALNLFKNLVKQDKALDTAMQAALENLTHSDCQIRTQAIILLECLCKKEAGLNLAYKFVREASLEKIESTLLVALVLVQQHGNKAIYDLANELVQSTISQSNRATIRKAFNVISKLIKKDYEQACELADQFVIRNMSYEHSEIRSLVYQLLEERFTKKQSNINEILITVNQNLHHTNPEVQQLAYDICELFILKDLGFKEIKNTAQGAIQSSDLTIIRHGLALFNLLVEQGKAFHAAHNAATRFKNDTDEKIKTLAREIIEKTEMTGQSGIQPVEVEILHDDE